MLNHTVNYIISLNTCHQHQHGQQIGTEKVLKKGENQNKSGRITSMHLLSVRASSLVMYVYCKEEHLSALRGSIMYYLST